MLRRVGFIGRVKGVVSRVVLLAFGFQGSVTAAVPVPSRRTGPPSVAERLSLPSDSSPFGLGDPGDPGARPPATPPAASLTGSASNSSTATQEHATYGPEDFLRRAGSEPTTYDRAFRIPSYLSSPYTLAVVNGDGGAPVDGRVPGGATASVYVDGDRVLQISDGRATRARSLDLDRRGVHTLRVVVGGAMGGHLRITVLGQASVGDLRTARSGHSATVLANGSILVAGGQGAAGTLASAEIVDPRRLAASTSSAALNTPRSAHSATLLPDARTLVAAGAGPLDSAELFSAAGPSFARLDAVLETARAGHTATLLLDGRVLILGGTDASGQPVATAEVFDPRPGMSSGGVFDTGAGTFHPLDDPLRVPRTGHTATLLPSGLVLVVGGRGPLGELASAELFDPATELSTLLGAALAAPRSEHTATLRSDGTVLIAGGRRAAAVLGSLEQFDPARGSFVPLPSSLHVARAGHAAALLTSGEVLLTGGQGTAGTLKGNELVGPASADSVPPRVVASLPADGAVDVDLGAIVAIRFSEPVDVRTVTAATLKVTTGGVAVPGSVSAGEAGLYAFFVPSAPLTPGATYEVTIGGQCRHDDDDHHCDDHDCDDRHDRDDDHDRDWDRLTAAGASPASDEHHGSDDRCLDDGRDGDRDDDDGDHHDHDGDRAEARSLHNDHDDHDGDHDDDACLRCIRDLAGNPLARTRLHFTTVAAAANQPPVVDAGADQTVVLRDNLLDNPGNDATLVAGATPGWTSVSGAWSQAPAGTGAFPPSFDGATYFTADATAVAELRQDVDLSTLGTAIDGGSQSFEIKGYLRASGESPAGLPRLVVEFRDASGAVLDTFDSADVPVSAYWHQVSATRPAPVGTRSARVRLISTPGLSGGGSFDALSLRALGIARTVTAALTGAATDDGRPSGTLEVAWTAVDAPSPVTFGDAAQAVTSATFTTAGAYRLRLTASDTQLSASDETIVTVVPQNLTPQVSAGADVTFSLPTDHTTLSGSAADDGLPQGSTLAVSWVQLTGPAPVTFATPEAVTTAVIFSAAGSYRLRLLASDSELVGAADVVVTVTGPNQPPVVDAGANQTIAFSSGAATLAGTVTDDGLPAGGTLTSLWTQAGGPGTASFADATRPQTSVTFSVPGTYTLRLAASDSALTATAVTTVFVDGPNAPPLVSAGPNQALTLPQDSVTLLGRVTDDGLPFGGTLSTSWSVLSGPGAVTFTTGNQPVTDAHFAAEGTYVLRLTASDTELSASAEVTVTLGPPAPANAAPAVSAGPNQATVLPIDTVTLTGAASDDGHPSPPGALTLAWTQTGGPEPATIGQPGSAATTVTMPAPGTYAFRLTANDGELSSTSEAMVTVSATPPPVANDPPTVDAGPSRTLTLPANTVTLDGSAEDDGRPSGTLTVHWSAVSGPSTVTFGDAGSAHTTATFSVAGSYTLRLGASDGEFTVFSDVAVTVTAANAGNQPPAVNAGPDRTTALPNAVVALSGTATDDGLPGASLAVSWTTVDGPRAATFDDAASAATSVRLSEAGVYVLRLTASDGEFTTSDDVSVTVGAAGTNLRPVVDAGPSQTITQPLNVATLAGLVSDDGLPDGTLTVRWTALSGADAVQFGDPSLPVTTATFARAGVFTLQLSAFDGQLTTTATTSVTVNAATFTSYLDTDWRYRVVSQGALPGFEQPGFDDSAFALGSAAFGISGFCDLNNPRFVKTNWPTGTDILLRKHFSAPGQVTNLTVGVGVDNDVQVWVNGVDVSGGMRVHEGCPSRDSFVFNVPASLLNPTDNVLAVRGRDRGGLDFLDVRMGAGLVPLPAPANQAPTVDAGPDQTLEPPASTADLQGTVADDGNPSAFLTVFWNKVSGPGNVTFGEPDFDAARNFSAVANPSGGWSYGYATTPGGAFNAFTVKANYTGGLPAWWRGADLRPALAFNPGAAPVSVGDGSVPARTIDLVVGGGQQTVLRWTVPADAVYFVRAHFQDIGSVPSDVRIVSPTLGTLFSGTVHFAGDTASLSQVVAAQAGESIDFMAATDYDTNDVALTVSITRLGAATATFSAPGTYVLRLAASDGQAQSSSDVTVTVLTDNEPPVVDAGPDQILTLPASSVTLEGTATDDGRPVGSTLALSWVQVAGPAPVAFASPAAAVTTATFSAVGTYTLRLTASDGVFSASSDVTVSVNPAAPVATNQPPAVSAGPSQTVTPPANTATLQGTAIDDGLPAGSLLAVSWSRVSGPGPVTFASPTTPVTTASFAVGGTYRLRLTAGDGQYAASADVEVSVGGNRPPQVSAGPEQTITLPTTEVTLSGTATDDGLPAGSALRIAWSQVSGPGHATLGDPANPVTTAAFDVPGTYVLRLTASDGALRGTSDVSVVMRGNDGNQPPLVSAGASQTLTLPTLSATLTGAASDDGLPVGGSLTVAWRQVSGPGPVVFTTPAALTTTATFPTTGVYVLRLSATDGLLGATSDVAVAVQGAAPVGAPPSVAITSPAEGAVVTSPVDIVGSVGSDTLFRWVLEYRRQGDEEWTRFASGSSAVAGAPLATFDPTLLMNGTFDVRLTATDTAARSTSVSFTAVVRDSQKVGNFTISFLDLEVPVAGLPIRITRTYDSRDKGRGDFGIGWRLDLSSLRVAPNRNQAQDWEVTTRGSLLPTYCIQQTRPHVLTLTFPDGRVQEFQQVLSPQCQAILPIEFATVTYQPRPGSLGTLVPVDGGDVFVSGSWPNGPATLIDFSTADLYQATTFQYTAPDGRVFVVDAAAGLRSLTDRNGNTLTVTASGITHSAGTGIAFARDAQGRIASITDPAGNALLYAYDDAGDLRSFTDRESNRTTYTYNDSHGLLTIEDPLGRQPLRNEYYDDGRIKSSTDASGKTIQYTHDVAGRQEIVVDRNGHQRVLVYDTRGNVVQETDAAGKVILRTFDARNNHLTETLPHAPGTPNPPKTVSTWDASDNLLSLTDPAGRTTRYTYNTRRQVLTTTDPNGRVSVVAYDTDGNATSTQDASGTVARYSYDEQGNPASRTVTVDGVDFLTRYEYDDLGRQTKEIDPAGHETSYTYDASGNRLTQTTTRSTASGLETLTTSYAYDRQQRLVHTTYPDGSVTRIVYDELGREKETYDRLDRKTSLTYDDVGRLAVKTFPDGTTEKYGYDGEGKRTSLDDRGGRTTTFEYDPLGRLTKTTYADGAFTVNAYDDAGRLTSATDARGHATTYGYDDAGLRTRVTDPLGNITRFEYDAAGRQTAVQDARGNRTSFVRDPMGQRIQTLFPDQTFTLTAYDPLGRRVSETDPAGRVTRFEYDRVGRLTKVTDARGQLKRFAYDEVGNRLSQTDGNEHTTTFAYDAVGRETSRTLPDGKTEIRTYDAAGNLRTRTDFAGRTTTLEYDSSDRLTSRAYVNTAENVGFTYTPTGRRRTATDARGTTSYDYDRRDRLTSLTYPDGRSLGYGYDAQGNRTSLTATIGATALTTASSYDDDNRLDTVTDPLGRVSTYGYDGNGNRTSLFQPNGTATAYAYDGLNRLTSLATTHPASSRTIQSYALTLGPAGNRTRIAEHDGSVRSYAYDETYRLTGEQVTVSGLADYEKLFTYDAAGNRVAQATTGRGSAGSPTASSSIAYAYDSRDQLITETVDASVPTAYAYDANGNLVTKAGAATYVWDSENRLVKVTKADGTVAEHAYDADGNRVQTKVTPATGPPTVTNYLVETSGELSQVVAETDGAGALQAAYIRGSDLLAVMRSDGAGGFSSRFYHTDGLGSVRRLTDETGNITDGYTYTAFGERIGHSGTDPQPYAFAGEPYDPQGTLQYHRARWMDPRTGRFLGMDPLDPMVSRLFDPPDLHRYTYAGDDPANATDPTGLQTLGEMNVSMSVSSDLRAGSAVNARAAQLAINRSWGKALEAQLERIVGQEFEIVGRQRALTGPGGRRIYDLMVKVGDRLFIIESKTNLPVGGSAFRRLIGQILTYSSPAEAEAAGAEVIVFSEGAAEAALQRITTTLAGEASPYFIQGFEGLMQFLRLIATGAL